jgi:hypothetical protein
MPVKGDYASEGGLLVYFPEQPEIGQNLNMKLFFTSGSTLHTVEIIAEVVWVDVHLEKTWGDYRAGVRFVSFLPDDMTKLKTFLRSLASS